MPTSGDWATWVQDILIGLTVFFAVKAYQKQSAALKLQTAEVNAARADRRREVEQLRRAQASYVFMDHVVTSSPFDPLKRSLEIKMHMFVTVEVWNASTLPVFDVDLHWNIQPEPDVIWVDSDNTVKSWRDASHGAQRILPSDRLTTKIWWASGEHSFGINPWVTFRDNAGVIWKVTKNGMLEEWGVYSPELPA
jgi:hypothetical protein